MMAVLDNIVQICESLKRQESRVLRYADAIARPGSGTKTERGTELLAQALAITVVVVGYIPRPRGGA